MSPTFKSGAFVQQCFSVHPLCLTLQKFAQPETVILACTSCRLTHRVTIRAMTTRVPVALASEEVTGSDERALSHLAHCAAEHPAAVSIREMDVVRDSLRFRCAECRRFYDLNVAAFETHQR
jgi:hypothetical protein